ncbi:minor tail protein [Gordonia phage Angelique]|nr:minor tail protein [Gordonia phage Angelique]
MTTPNLPPDTAPENLPNGVMTPASLASDLQDHSSGKIKSVAANRFPSHVNSTAAGNPANVGGPLGFIVNLFSNFVANLAAEDPANVKRPEDLLPKVSGFFNGLPVLQALVLTPLSYLLGWILGDDPENWDSIEELRDNLIPALIRLPLRILAQLIGGIPIIGDAVEDALAGWLRTTNENATDAIETVVSVGTQLNYVQELIVVRTGRPFWETGPDRTACVSFPFGLMNLPMSTISIGGGAHSVSISGFTGYTNAAGDNHRHAGSALDASAPNHVHTVTLSTTPPSVKATATYAPWGTVIFDSAAERKVVNWIAWKSGTVSTFFIDLYRLEPDGTSTYTGYSTPDLAGALATMPAWMSHLMDGASIVADIDDAYEAQFRMTGSGDVHIAGVNMPNPIPLPGFRPYTNGSGRNPSTTPVPASLSLAARDAMYTGPTPFVGFGIDVGQVNLPRVHFDNFNRSSLGPRWITYGPIGISNNKVQFTGSAIANSTAAAMYHQPLASDVVRVSADLSVDAEDIGFGACCSSGLGSGVWLVVDDSGIALSTGAYNSRTTRASNDADDPPSGLYTIERVPSEDETHYIFHVYFGNPEDEENEPILTWPDTTGIVGTGAGRRWVGTLARRNGLINPSGRLDNFTAADITITEEP